MQMQLLMPILLIFRVCFLSDDIRQSLSISRIATITFVHGPQGSGKTAMLDAVLKQSDRWFMHSNFLISGDLSYFSPGRGLSSTVENSRVPHLNHNSSLHWQPRLATGPCSLSLWEIL